MASIKRVQALMLPIPLTIILFTGVPGCGDSGDPMKASDGTPKKTPSQVLKEAKESAGKPAPKAE